MASSGFPTRPAQLLPPSIQGNPGGTLGSTPAAAPCAAASLSTAAMADNGARPRTVRSRFVATKSCSAGASEAQFLGKTIDGRPSIARALSIAVTTTHTQRNESLYSVNPHVPRKFGDGGTFDAG